MGPGGIVLLLIYIILLFKYNPCAHNLSHKLLRFYLHSQSIMLWTQKFLMCNIFLCPIKEWSWWWASSVASCADRWTMWWQNHCPGFTFPYSVSSFHQQITLSTIFESMGWRVFRVPETATILLGGGVSFSLLDDEQRLEFQVNF